MGMLGRMMDYLDNMTGVKNCLAYILFGAAAMLAYDLYLTSPPRGRSANPQQDEEDEPDPPRNFTKAQLRYFDGKLDEKTGEVKPVYMSVNGIVFDVSHGRSFYGPEGPYAQFAGRECGIALAKMAFDEEFLDDLDGYDKLSLREKDELNGWIDKFTYWRPYPVMGRYVPPSKLPDPNRILTSADLAKHTGNTPAVMPKKQRKGSTTAAEPKKDEKEKDATTKNGEQAGEPTPEGYAVAPIYIGAGDKVFDMSFGGVTFYGKGGPYEQFAGHDASRALATMDLKAPLHNTSTADCDEKQLKVLQDWITTFETKKLYPVVGRLQK